VEIRGNDAIFGPILTGTAGTLRIPKARSRTRGDLDEATWWASLESNRGPQSYQDCALTD
jgi:hypothetical protein